MVKKKIQEEPVRRLYRSKEDKVIGGVCGGIADYFTVDPVWVRLIAILLLILDGIGFIAYIILWILVPENPKQKSTKKTLAEEKVELVKEKVKNHSKESSSKEVIKEKNGHSFMGIILIIIGTLYLIKNVFGWFDAEVFWGILIISLGLLLLMRK